MYMKIIRTRLEDLYLRKKSSASHIAKKYKVSENKINYWLKKYNIPKRSISEAIYVKANPLGDPFTSAKPKSKEEWFLHGLGLGLYWGEGTKSNKHSVRLGNTDPALVVKFLEFLERIYTTTFLVITCFINCIIY